MMPNTSVYSELLVERQLCDAVIKVDDVELPAHKIILCNCSPYFRTLFTQWSTPECRVFKFPHVSPRMFKAIIEFAYTGNVPVTPENVQELFVVADRFIVQGIIKACGDFMEEMMEPQNCIGIWRFTDFYYHPEVRDKAFLFFLNHFEEVATTEEFQSLSAQELVQVIKRDELRVTKEDKVSEAVLRWIVHAPEERRGHLPQLLSNVRLALMNPEYFSNNVAENKMVKANRECQSIVSNTMDAMLEIRANGNSIPLFGNPLARPRLPPAILFAVGCRIDGGGNSGEWNDVFEAYDMHADSWVSVNKTEADVQGYQGTAYLDGFIYFIGGFDTIVASKCTASRFDLVTRKWQKVASMHWRRRHISVTVMDGYIYALGGSDWENHLAFAERYLPSANQWTEIASMKCKRSDAASTSLRGKVYICGGVNGNVGLSTAECYNPETDQWTLIAEMSTRRARFGVIASADHIFAVGGFTGTTYLSSVEVYDPDDHTWHHVAPMHNPGCYFGIELIDDCLFVVGGSIGPQTTSCERYDIKTNVWSKVCGMVKSCHIVRCCLASGFPNLAEYAAPRPDLHEG